MAAKPKLEKIPGFSQGVRVNSAQRMIKLAVPICPFSQVEHERDSGGQLRAKEKSPGEQNCQREGGRWWDECIKREHDPYFRTQTWYTMEPILEQDDKGRLVKTGDQWIHHSIRQPNISQVAVNVRINSGKGAMRKIERHGFKRLSDLGYEEVCQYRNCQKPVSPQATSRKYGAFCSRMHLALVTADVESEMLHQPNSYLNGNESEKVLRARDRQLREVLTWTVET